MITKKMIKEYMNDERKASSDYRELAWKVGVNTEDGEQLIEMSKDEGRHFLFWQKKQREIKNNEI